VYGLNVSHAASGETVGLQQSSSCCRSASGSETQWRASSKVRRSNCPLPRWQRHRSPPWSWSPLRAYRTPPGLLMAGITVHPARANTSSARNDVLRIAPPSVFDTGYIAGHTLFPRSGLQPVVRPLKRARATAGGMRAIRTSHARGQAQSARVRLQIPASRHACPVGRLPTGSPSPGGEPKASETCLDLLLYLPRSVNHAPRRTPRDIAGSCRRKLYACDAGMGVC